MDKLQEKTTVTEPNDDTVYKKVRSSPGFDTPIDRENYSSKNIAQNDWHTANGRQNLKSDKQIEVVQFCEKPRRDCRCCPRLKKTVARHIVRKDIARILSENMLQNTISQDKKADKSKATIDEQAYISEPEAGLIFESSDLCNESESTESKTGLTFEFQDNYELCTTVSNEKFRKWQLRQKT